MAQWKDPDQVDRAKAPSWGTMFHRAGQLSVGACRKALRHLGGSFDVVADEPELLCGGIRVKECAILLMHYRQPMRDPEEFEVPAALERATWSGAREAVAEHTAWSHLILVRGEKVPVQGLLWFTMTAYQLATEARPSAVHHGPAGRLHAPEDLVRAVRTLEDDRMPLEFWIGGGVWKNKQRLIACTQGMRQLGSPDIEVRCAPEQCSTAALGEYVDALVSHVAQNGMVFQPGDTVEGPQGGKWKCDLGPSLAHRGRRVLTIDAPRPSDAAEAPPPPPAFPTLKRRRRRR